MSLNRSDVEKIGQAVASQLAAALGVEDEAPQATKNPSYPAADQYPSFNRAIIERRLQEMGVEGQLLELASSIKAAAGSASGQVVILIAP